MVGTSNKSVPEMAIEGVELSTHAIFCCFPFPGLGSRENPEDNRQVGVF